MPSRKQRRRREKERRHEWEEVFVDEEGREIAPEEAERVAAVARERGRENGRQPARTATARRRGVEPPSWRRVGKRALLFAPLMFLVITFLEPGTSVAARVLYTAQLILLFIPFSYVVDSFAYRMYRRRVDEGAGSRGG